jgi:hypothetical protein
MAGLLALPFTWTLAVSKDLSHDEHQHVAAGMLLAREGLLPYKDFPYLHTPYLVFVYGFLFHFTKHPLLVARLFTAICDAFTVSLLVFTAYAMLRNRSWLLRLGISIAAIVFLLTNSLFAYTAGRAWNQDPSVLLFLLAGLFYVGGAKHPRKKSFLFVTGLCLGIAIGFRVTIAPLTLPILVGIAFYPNCQKKIALGGALALGLMSALLPMAVLFVIAPRGFIFGNVEFPHLAVLHRELTGNPRTMTLVKKLRYLVKNVIRPNYQLFLAAAIILYLWWRECRVRQKWCLGFFAGLLPFVCLGCMAPSPLFYQYFYVFAPLLLLMSVYALASLETYRTTTIGVCVFALLAGLSLLTGAKYYRQISILVALDTWFPMKIHRTGDEIRKFVTQGRVLTLAPIIPLEGSLSIYPALGTGPFAWRIAPFVDLAHRRQINVIGPDDLPGLLEDDPPGGILLGMEKSALEEPLLRYAREHRYVQTKLKNKVDLWIIPGQN